MNSIGFQPSLHATPRPATKAADLQLDYKDGVNSLLDVALLPSVDSVIHNSLTLGSMGPRHTHFSGLITQANQPGLSQSVEASRNNDPDRPTTETKVAGENVEVASAFSVENGANVQRGEVGEYHFESRTGFDAQLGAFVNEGFIARGVTGEQIDFRRELRQLPGRAGTSFSGHIGGLPDQGTIKVGKGELLIDRHVGEYHIAGSVRMTDSPPLIRPF